MSGAPLALRCREGGAMQQGHFAHRSWSVEWTSLVVNWTGCDSGVFDRQEGRLVRDVLCGLQAMDSSLVDRVWVALCRVEAAVDVCGAGVNLRGS